MRGVCVCVCASSERCSDCVNVLFKRDSEDSKQAIPESVRIIWCHGDGTITNC